MKNDYVAGPHHYWTHFWCGLFFGAAVGVWLGWQAFDSGWLVIAAAIAASISTAFLCGHWGDQAWHWLLQRLTWFF